MQADRLREPADNEGKDRVMWSKAKLQERSAQRRHALAQDAEAVDAALLAYARWQGMTDEQGVNRDEAKQELDVLIDDMEPERWRGVEDALRGDSSDLTKGLMVYALQRALEQSREHANELDPGPSRKRRRDRSR